MVAAEEASRESEVSQTPAINLEKKVSPPGDVELGEQVPEEAECKLAPIPTNQSASVPTEGTEASVHTDSAKTCQGNSPESLAGASASSAVTPPTSSTETPTGVGNPTNSSAVTPPTSSTEGGVAISSAAVTPPTSSTEGGVAISSSVVTPPTSGGVEGEWLQEGIRGKFVHV